MLESALRFGWSVARGHLDATASAALAPGWDVADLVMVAEVMALAFVQVSGVLIANALLGRWLMKNWMPVVARQDLAEIRAELGQRVQAYLADNADSIRESFEEEFGRMYPRFARVYNSARRPADEPVELWDVPFNSPGLTSTYTVRQLLDQVLRPTVGGVRIGQDVFQVSRADSGGLDRRGGPERDVLPLVVLELRESYGQLSGKVGYPLMVEIMAELAGMARQGEAAAEFARRLPVSLEGQLVAAWLRQVAAMPEGAERDRAAGLLRRAAGWYAGRVSRRGRGAADDAWTGRRARRREPAR